METCVGQKPEAGILFFQSGQEDGINTALVSLSPLEAAFSSPLQSSSCLVP